MTNKLFFIRSEVEGGNCDLLVVAESKEQAEEAWVAYYDIDGLTVGLFHRPTHSNIESWVRIDEVPLDMAVAGAISWDFVDCGKIAVVTT